MKELGPTNQNDWFNYKTTTFLLKTFLKCCRHTCLLCLRRNIEMCTKSYKKYHIYSLKIPTRLSFSGYLRGTQMISSMRNILSLVLWICTGKLLRSSRSLIQLPNCMHLLTLRCSRVFCLDFSCCFKEAEIWASPLSYLPVLYGHLG